MACAVFPAVRSRWPRPARHVMANLMSHHIVGRLLSLWVFSGQSSTHPTPGWPAFASPIGPDRGYHPLLRNRGALAALHLAGSAEIGGTRRDSNPHYTSTQLATCALSHIEPILLPFRYESIGSARPHTLLRGGHLIAKAAPITPGQSNRRTPENRACAPRPV